MLRSAFCLVVLVAYNACFAGPLEGDMFGYRIGNKYKVEPTTKGAATIMGGALILADKPDMPSEFVRLEIIATPKTYTIATIYTVAEFGKEEEAKEFAAKYADLLGTMYSTKCAPSKAYLQEALKLICAKKFEVTVHQFKPDKPDEKHKVHVMLKSDSFSPYGKQITKQFESEFNQLVEEGKKKRLDQANKDQKLKGLK